MKVCLQMYSGNIFLFQNTKNKTAVKLTAVSCAPVVEVKIKRPDTKYQLGFSVQNGVVSGVLKLMKILSPCHRNIILVFNGVIFSNGN